MSAWAQTYTNKDVYTLPDNYAARRLGVERIVISTNDLGQISVKGRTSSFKSCNIVLLSGTDTVLSCKGRKLRKARIDSCRVWTADTPDVYTLRVSKRKWGTMEFPVVFRNVSRTGGGQLLVSGKEETPFIAYPVIPVTPVMLKELKLVGYDAVATRQVYSTFKKACYEKGLYLLDYDTFTGSDRLDIIRSFDVIREKTAVATSDKPVRSEYIPNLNRILVESGMLADSVSLRIEVVSDGIRHLYDGVASLGRLRYDDTLAVPFFAGNLSPYGDVYLNLDYYGADSTHISANQIMLQKPIRLFYPKGGRADVQSTANGILLNSRNWSAEFDDRICLLGSYKLKGTEMLVSPVRPGNWSTSGTPHSKFTISRGYSSLDSEGRSIRYDISGGGAMETEVNTPNERASVTFVLPSGMDNLKYYGRGPQQETMLGWGKGRIAIWHDKGECSHTDLRWMEITDDSGKGFGVWSNLDFVGSLHPVDGGVTVKAEGILDRMTFYIYPLVRKEQENSIYR